MNKKEILSTIYWVIGVVAVMMLVRKFIVTPVVVSGKSMDPTMENRERVFALRQGDIERFDIVTFPAPDQKGKNYIKRVIGLPGDKIRFEKDQLFINDKEVSEPYLDEYKDKLVMGDYLTKILKPGGSATSVFDLNTLFDEEVVPSGKLFVMGDNRQISKDSRLIGYIDEKDISGNVKFSFWPPSKFGKVN